VTFNFNFCCTQLSQYRHLHSSAEMSACFEAFAVPWPIAFGRDRSVFSSLNSSAFCCLTRFNSRVSVITYASNADDRQDRVSSSTVVHCATTLNDDMVVVRHITAAKKLDFAIFSAAMYTANRCAVSVGLCN